MTGNACPERCTRRLLPAMSVLLSLSLFSGLGCCLWPSVGSLVVVDFDDVRLTLLTVWGAAWSLERDPGHEKERSLGWSEPCCYWREWSGGHSQVGRRK